MMIYGTVLKTNESEELTLEEFIELQSDALEIMTKLHLESCEDKDPDDDFESFEEGANLDYRAAYKKGSKIAIEHITQAKKAKKDGDIPRAKKHLKQADKALADVEKVLKDVDSTAGSAVLGFFASNLLTIGENIVPFGLMCIGTTMSVSAVKSLITSKSFDISKIAGKYGFGIGMADMSSFILAINSLIRLIKQIVQFTEDWKDKDISTTQAFNKYRNHLLTYTKEMRKNVASLEKQL